MIERFRAVLVLALFVGGCGGDGTPTAADVPPFDGWWKGGLSGERILVYAHDDDGHITGSASVGGSVSAIEGTHSHPNVTFATSATDPAAGDWSFSGTFADDDTVEGSVTGEVVGGTLVLTRDAERNR